MRITSKINMDLLRPAHPVVINAVQGDQNTRCLEISLYSGGAAWQIPAGATAAMRYCKADKTKGYYDTMPDGTTAWSVSGNVISVLLAPQMLTAPGTVLAQVELLQGIMILGTWIIQISVTPNLVAGVLVSEDYINWLQWIEGELDEYLEKVKANSEILGGTVVGPINMNGQALTGLNAPTSADGAANKGYVDDSKTEAVTEAKNYVNEQVRMARPRNLLDNSNFANPVNQRSVTSWNTLWTYGIDRWVIGGDGVSVASVESDGIKLTPETTDWSYLFQYLESLPVGVYTYAAKFHGNTAKVGLSCTNGTEKNTTNAEGIIAIPVKMTAEEKVPFFRLDSFDGATVTWEWAALYEGEYTTETLPEYQPKGYGAELDECQRYCQVFTQNNTLLYGNSGSATGTAIRLFIPTQVAMRINPTVNNFLCSFSLHSGTKNNLTFTPSSALVSGGGISLYGSSSEPVSESPNYVNVVCQIRNADLVLSADL